MSEYPGVHRKGAGRGWRYRYHEFDPVLGKAVQRTSKEFSSARKAASDRSIKLREINAAGTAARRPTREGITIEGAWEKHPSTIREPEDRRKKYRRMLKAFTDHVRYVELRKLSFADVADWVAELKTGKPEYPEGFAWSTRFHYLMPLRRAAAMAVTFGLPDVLAELSIDERDEEEHNVQAWTLSEIAQAWHQLADNRRARVALALGAFVGLRPSEIYRAKCGDLDPDGRLAIGIRQVSEAELRAAKNKPSRRKLPLPAIVLAEVRALIGTRSPDKPLISTHKGKASGPFNEITLVEWLGPLLEQATGRALTPKHLRKSFASWVIAAAVDFWHAEAYMGRDTPMTKSITGRRYLADFYNVISKLLDPVALQLNALIATALAEAATKIGATNGAHPDLGPAAGHDSMPQDVSKPGHIATN